MLQAHDAILILPAADLARAEAWYRDKLGLEPTRDAGGLYYRTGATQFHVYETGEAGTARNTQGGWYVDDLDAVVAELRGRGVGFEEYDLPGLTTVDGIADLGFERAAWFHDSEGNTLVVAQRTG